MKKILCLVLSLTLACSVTACISTTNADEGNTNSPSESQSASTENTSNDTPTDIASYFKFNDNTLYQYKGQGDPSGDQGVYITYDNGDTVQRRVTSDFVDTTEVMQLKDGTLKLVYGDSSQYLPEDVTSAASNLDITIMQEPLTEGSTWNYSSEATSEITDKHASVDVPYGTYDDCMEIDTTFNDGTIQKDYYAQGVGLVQSNYYQQGEEFSSKLENITENTDVEITTPIYYADAMQDVETPQDQAVDVTTNCDVASQFETLLKETPNDNCVPLFTPNTKINSINVDRDANSLTLDLSSDFISESNYGDGVMSIVLQGIVDTLGNFYGTDTVQITIDGATLEHGSIVLSDPSTVNKATADNA